MVPVEDVWRVHGLASGHDVGDLQHIGPPWNSRQLPGLPAIAVKPDSVAAAYTLRGQFRSAHSLALFPAEVLNDLYVTLDNVRDLMSLLAIATQVLVVVVLMALMVGFLARRRQLAVLRAIGASRTYVFCVVWIEVVRLIAGGAVLGTLLGWGGSMVFSKWMQTQTGFEMPVSLGAAEFLLVAGLMLGGCPDCDTTSLANLQTPDCRRVGVSVNRGNFVERICSMFGACLRPSPRFWWYVKAVVRHQVKRCKKH